jgi:hypothetical protein
MREEPIMKTDRGNRCFHRLDALNPLRPREVLCLLLFVLCVTHVQAQTIIGHAPVDLAAVSFGTGVIRTVSTTALILSPTVDTVIDSYTINGANSQDFMISSESCAVGSTITAGASCAVKVSFTPGGVGCRTALLRVTSHDPTQNLTMVDVVPLVAAGIGPELPGTVPVDLPFTARFQGVPVLTPVANSTEQQFTYNPVAMQTQGGLTQLSARALFIPAVDSMPARSVLYDAVYQFTSPAGDTLILCGAAATLPLDPATGRSTGEGVLYVTSGTGRFAGAMGRIITSGGATGTVTTEFSGTLTLQFPARPFAYISLVDLLRSY